MQITVSRAVLISSSLPIHCFCHCFLFSSTDWNYGAQEEIFPHQLHLMTLQCFICLFIQLHSLSDGNQVQAFPPRQDSSAARFLVSFLCKKCGLEKSCYWADWIVWKRVKMRPELIRPGSVNDRVRAKDLASEKLQGLSGRRSGALSTICF